MTPTLTAEIQKRANSVARKHGHGKATHVIFGYCANDHISDSTPYGYRKNTTGEYVPNAYRNHFGWKNTYYQHAKCTVVLAVYTK